MNTQELPRSEIWKILKVAPKLRNNTHIEALTSLTNHVEFFEKITQDHNSKEIHKECCHVMSLEEYEKNDIIFNFGETGEKFYIIFSGSVSVLIPVKKMVKVTKEEFKRLTTLNQADSMSESSEDDDQDEEIEKQEKIMKNLRKHRRESIIKERRNGAVSAIEILEKLRNEDKLPNSGQDSSNPYLENEEKIIARLFRDKLVKEKKELLKIIQDLDREFIEIEIDKLEEVSIIPEGGSFGDLALLSDRPRSATIIAREHTSLLVLRKFQFKQILGNISEKRMNLKIKFLQSLPYFLSWSKNSLAKLAFYFQPFMLNHKQYLFIEGQKTNGIYFIKEGEFILTKKIQFRRETSPIHTFSGDDQIVPKKQIRLPLINSSLKVIIKGKNESVGGYELLHNLSMRTYSCMCSSTISEVYFIQKEHFLSRIPNIDVIKEIIEEENLRLEDRFEKVYGIEETKNLNDSSFRITPDFNKPTLTSRNQGMVRSQSKIQKNSFSPTPTKIMPVSKSTLENKKKNMFRKLTQQEIFEAINGRNNFRPTKQNRVRSLVQKRCPPANFMQKMREQNRPYYQHQSIV